MAQYYYDKYNVVTTNSYSDVAPWVMSQPTIVDFTTLYKSYTFDDKLNKYRGAGSKYAYQESVLGGDIGYATFASDNSLRQYTSTYAGMAGSNLDVYTKEKDASKNTLASTTYTKGSLVQSNIVAEDGTYPVNDIKGGFWYTRRGLVDIPPNLVSDGGVISNVLSFANSRKLVVLSNGWYVAATLGIGTSVGIISIYVSKDKGVKWDLTQTITGANTAVAITDIGNNQIGIVYHTNNALYYRALTVDTNKLGAVLYSIGNGTSFFGLQSASLHYDKANNKIYIACTISTNGTAAPYYPTIIASNDKGSTWNLSSLSSYVISGSNGRHPAISTVNGRVVMSFSRVSSSDQYINYVLIAKTSDTIVDFSTIHQESLSLGITVSPISLSVGNDNTIYIAYSVDTTAGNVKTRRLNVKRSTDFGLTWSEPTKYPTNRQMNHPSISVDKNGKVLVAAAPSDNTNDKNMYVFTSTDKAVNFKPDGIQVGEGTDASTIQDNTFAYPYGDIPPMLYRMYAPKDGIMFAGALSTNNAPNVTLVMPDDNTTLYENDTLRIYGDAYDSDKDQSVTAYYQINSEPRKVLATNVSQTQISLNKQLTFRGGKLFDGDIALTGNLTDGVSHTLKVWAVDNEGSQSATVERAFYVVPNRAPLLSVDAVVPAGVVDTDKFKISGTSSDQDANSNLKVTRKINSNNPVEIYSGSGGDWEFEISLAQLVIGENTIVVEVIDNYGAKTSKTIKLNKNEVKTPILQSVARYKIKPPSGSAKGVLLFIERDKDMDLKVELSMTLVGEQEQYETITPDNTAPMPNTNGIVEDTFYHETNEAKDNIILKLSTSRPDTTVNHKIHLISGAVD